MARILIVGCGCRGHALARTLVAAGHAVRGTTRSDAGVHGIEAAGAEAWTADPDRVASLSYALDQVTVLCHLLGSARGDPAALAALHGPRLAMLLERSIDTTIRGVLYEATGTVDHGVLAGGADIVRQVAERSEVPAAILEEDPADHRRWVRSAEAAVGRLLARGPALDSPRK